MMVGWEWQMGDPWPESVHGAKRPSTGPRQSFFGAFWVFRYSNIQIFKPEAAGSSP